MTRHVGAKTVNECGTFGVWANENQANHKFHTVHDYSLRQGHESQSSPMHTNLHETKKCFVASHLGQFLWIKAVKGRDCPLLSVALKVTVRGAWKNPVTFKPGGYVGLHVSDASFRQALKSWHLPENIWRGCMRELKCPSRLLRTFCKAFSCQSSSPKMFRK